MKTGNHASSTTWKSILADLHSPVVADLGTGETKTFPSEKNYDCLMPKKIAPFKKLSLFSNNNNNNNNNNKNNTVS